LTELIDYRITLRLNR